MAEGQLELIFSSSKSILKLVKIGCTMASTLSQMQIWKFLHCWVSTYLDLWVTKK